jgi:hypothetical protein
MARLSRAGQGSKPTAPSPPASGPTDPAASHERWQSGAVLLPTVRAPRAAHGSGTFLDDADGEPRAREEFQAARSAWRSGQAARFR